eukprot:CAMPEP_0204328524 /NCGR_PEP_ID=MMETSP0469-20131031/13432_1 /ASSEMBLY_ACC=CAM_ASM_000384 /TAXON_ID=2969 /ORGANISM="Oxyrrhis marina" /LENGTH=124 /DNA_ID=CAMNT_0051310935 /DNA_START=89 /DNA_END=465 /DNA_ORIENTATION=+
MQSGARYLPAGLRAEESQDKNDPEWDGTSSATAAQRYMCSAGVDDDRKDLREPPDTGGSLSPDFPRVWRRLVGELLLVLRREPALSVILRVSDMCSTRQGSEDPGLMQVRAPVEVFSKGVGTPD